MKRFPILVTSIIVLAIITFFINLNIGFAKLNFSDFINSESENFQIAGFRINRALAMLLAGIAIPTSGFLLQEYFKNPLAGPDVLGITSVSSLFVAFYIFFSQNIVIPDFLQNSFISLSSIIGSIVLMMILLLFSNRFRDKSFIIIFGFLISALAGAVVSFLQFYVESQSLKNYILWTFGANNQASLIQISILTVLIIIGLIFTFKSIKPLIGNALGNAYAQSFGINQSKLKISIIVASSLLSASVTAFLGPILFIGVVVPHVCRMIWNPAQLWHQWILNMILGIFIMQVFSIISELSQFPINIITTFFGIPVILLMLMKSNK
ncbi:FecCD family ABC transporter permease [Epilithonimonas arachidiradicis]|uniref:Iron ABC transporter n=1 Tax=Epilithonimonas arachidiradicis TaxID=1617282 RepID=A0A420CXZ4_9FLAO|nr:iron ABC transporter permease [Epilithonimonas arachidiradicis]RKE83172.1 iron complex transport system permease protein [Epilithonimonas arachidiradicis]GGG65476.1 iron ABC transporter [Epilithonimonas arachidiradicis]